MAISAEISKLPQSSLKIDVVIDAAEVQQAIDGTYDEIAKKARFDGFRPGKVPRWRIKQKYGESLDGEISERLVNNAFRSVVHQHRLHPVGGGTVIGSLPKPTEQQPYSFSLQVDVFPEVATPAWREIPVLKPTYEVRDRDLDAEIGKICERFAAFEDLPDGVVRKDGFATVAIDVFFAGEKVENLSRPAYLYDLSTPPSFPDLKKSLAGKKVGESFEVKGAFPKDFPDADKAGKDAVFAVTVQQARQRVIPGFNDELAARVEAGKTAAALREEIRRSMEERAAQHVQNRLREQIGEYLIDKAKDVELPESMLQGEVDAMLRDFARRLAYMRVTLEDYLAKSGETLEKIREAYRPAAEKQLRLMLMLNAIIREEKIDASEEEMGQALQDLAKRAGKDYEEMLGALSDEAVEGVRFDISRAKAWEALLGAARVKAGKSHSYADLVEELEKKES